MTTTLEIATLAAFFLAGFIVGLLTRRPAQRADPAVPLSAEPSPVAAPGLLKAASAALHYMRLHKYADQAWADDLEAAIAAAVTPNVRRTLIRGDFGNRPGYGGFVSRRLSAAHEASAEAFALAKSIRERGA